MAARRPPAVFAAAVLAAVPVLLLAVPWWTAPPPVVLTGRDPAMPGPAASWVGWDLVGPLRGTLLVVLLAGAAVALVAGRAAAARALLVAGGAASAVVGVEVLLGWGAGAPTVIAVVTGVGAALLAAVGAPVVLVVALLAAVIPMLPGGPAPTAGAQVGPFQRIARLDATELRSGTAGLAATGPASVVVVDGLAGVVTPDGLAVVDERGRTRVLARTPDGPRDRPAIIGVADGRVVRWTAADALTVTGLTPDDPVAVTVEGVRAASRLGADGVMWVRATGDPPGAARRLDLAERGGVQETDAVFLPVVTILPPVDSAPVDVAALQPVGDGAVRAVAQEAGYRLERLTSGPDAVTDVTLLAGGLDSSCGLTSSGPGSFLAQVGPLATGTDGTLWFTVSEPTRPDPAQLLRLDTGGTLRAVSAPLPGSVDALAVEPDGAVVLAVRGPDAPALWRLADPDAALAELPPPPVGCGPAAPLAPPVTLVPVARPGGDTLGVPLGADGRWAAGGTDPAGEVTLLAPDGTRTPVGARDADATGFVPDGAGGIWWWEPEGGLVHADRAGLQRHPADPPGAALALVPDLGGRPPLLATEAGAFRLAAGGPVPVVEGPVDGGVVRADGRGWLLAGGRLLALENDRVLGPAIDAGDRRADATPVAVQLARGVAPAALALPRAAVALDARGQAIVIADDVVLGVGDDGTVTVLAQDRRLVGLPVSAAEGGAVATGSGELLRLDLPG
jgi:hypothetical protein